jgi:tetratricopeptide (TPR) repeat protein
MSRIEKTIFISYRRTNLPWALCIYQNLTMHGYDAFFDYQSIDSGNFEKVILENIKTRAHFLVILTPSALERLKEPNDWLRREIEMAIDEKRNIIPLMLESFDFGSPLATQALTGKLAALNTYNGLKVYSEYFFEAMDKLRDRYLNVALDRVYLPELNAEAKAVTEAQTSAASEAPKVEKEELTAQEWFERGYVYAEAKNVNEAIRCYSKAIELDPSDASAYSNLGNLLSDENLKRYEEAEVAYGKAIELNPSYASAYSNLGILLRNLKRYDEAEVSYRKAIELNPSDATAYSNLGLLLHENLKRYGEAEVSYRKAIELDPSDATAYSNLGNLLSDENLKRYDKAEASYRKAIELNPSDATAYSNLGALLGDLKRNEEAEASFRKAIELNPSDASAYYNLGRLLGDLERNKEAEAAYGNAIVLNPLGSIAANAYSNLGALLLNLKRYEESEASCRKAIELNPSEASAYGNLGNLLRDNFSNRNDEAEAAYHKVIEINPTDYLTFFNLGVLYKNLKRYEEAEAAYGKAIELNEASPSGENPSYATAYNNLVMLLRVTDQTEKALPLLEKMIELNPVDFNSYLGIASIKKILGESIDPAFIEKARQYIPEDDFYNRACLESVCDNFDLAFEYLQRAAQKEKFNPTWAWEDPDFQWLRDDPRFVEIVGAKPEK